MGITIVSWFPILSNSLLIFLNIFTLCYNYLSICILRIFINTLNIYLTFRNTPTPDGPEPICKKKNIIKVNNQSLLNNCNSFRPIYT